MSMAITVWIEPHEIGEALEAYKSWLTEAQVNEITGAPDGAIVKLTRSGDSTDVQIIEEGG
jgi:hypothetical protein